MFKSLTVTQNTFLNVIRFGAILSNHFMCRGPGPARKRPRLDEREWACKGNLISDWGNSIVRSLLRTIRMLLWW